MAIRDRIKQTAAKSDGGGGEKAATAFRRPSGRAAYPHRKSLDLTTEQNTWLSDQAWQSRVTAVGLVRGALDYLEAHPEVLVEVVEAVQAIERPDR
jgi:hypothetical protein